MSNKEKQRLKRQDKQRQLRKLKSQSPWERIESRGTIEACLVSGGWRESGLAAVVFVVREPNGRAAVVSFEVDVWCRGLRDVVGRLDVSDLKIEGILGSLRQSTHSVKVPPEEGRQLVAGGIRFAQENHFRLPADWQKLAAVVGVTTWGDADLSQFRKDGKLCFVGDLDDLQKSYLEDVGAFMQREDVHTVVRSQGGQEVNLQRVRTKLDRMNARLTEALQPFIEQTRAWCHQRNEEPSLLLPKVAERMSVGVSLGLVTMGKWEPSRLVEGLEGAMNVYLSTLDAAGKEAANRAAGQFLKCLDETNAKEAWVTAVAEATASLAEPEGGEEA